MAYLSLYRKHRPRTFSEVVGQDHVTRTLVNAIEEDRLHHAYLFTGQRGTGKTSTARILAAAVNCEQGPTPTPCGTCEQCTTIVAGRNVDVVEMDMASHGGVDDARDLRDRAVFAPASARRKVYILDEVHMATNAAFNALLKLVEEPPDHVLFAMATTDPQKVLPTIMSRVQRLDLRRVPAVELTAHLDRIGELEGFALDPDAAAAVAAAGDGSVRDTLSVLEQVLAYAADRGARDDGTLQVSAGHVERVLGTTPVELVLGIVDAVADADVAGALTGVQRLLEGGHDLRRFTLDLARHLRDLLVLRAAPDTPELVDATAERRERLAAQSQRFGVDTLLRAVELVGEVLVEQRQGPPRLPLELAIARMASPGADGDLQALADRVARLETGQGVAGAVPAPASRPNPAGATAARAASDDGRATAPAEAAPGAPAGVDEASGASAEAPPTAAPDTAASGTSAPAEAPPAVGEEPSASAEAPAPDAATDAGSDETQPELASDAPRDATVDGPGTDTADTGTAGSGAAHGDGSDTVAAGTGVSGSDDPGPSDADAPADDAAEPAPAAGAVERARARAAARGQGADPVETAAAGGATAGPPAGDEDPDATPDDPAADHTLLPDTASGQTTVPDPSDGRRTNRPDGEEALAAVVERWEAILELVADGSRRAKAFYEPGTPAALRDGILTLRYPDGKKFHAEQARSGEMVQHLAVAVARATGLENIRVDVRFADEPVRRPVPPPMEPAHDVPGSHAAESTPAEQADVAEAEASPVAVDEEELDGLVRSELGGEPLPDDDAAG